MAKSLGFKVAVRGALVAAMLASAAPAANAAGFFSFPFSFSGVSGGGYSIPKPGGFSFFGNWGGGSSQVGGFWGVTNLSGFTFGFFWGRPISPYAA